MEAVNFHHESFLDTADQAQSGRSLELHLAALSALCSRSCVVVRVPRSSRARRGLWLCQPTLGTPRQEAVIFGESWQASPGHGQRSLPPLRQPSEAAGSSLESAPASLHPCSPDRPALPTSASVQSRTSDSPHPLQILLLCDYSSCETQDPACAFYVGGVSSVRKRSASLGTVLLHNIPQNYNAEGLQSDKIME